MPGKALLQSEIPGVPVRRGKVRDIYDFGDKLLFVATDRISAFDWVLPDGIPDKGRVLTLISEMWFETLGVTNHLLSMDVNQVPLPAGVDKESLVGRSMVVKKTQVVPIECVVRGYLSGSGWKEYRQSGSVCGIELPDGLIESQQLPEPIFTPATKAEVGDHDENISFERAADIIGADLAARVRDISIQLYQRAADFALTKGIIIADTKFEFGLDADGTLTLMDEVLTPDSSRYWPVESYAPGSNPPSYDKQFVRDWLEQATVDGKPWGKTAPAPALPPEVIARTVQKYEEALQRLTA